jgi:hypothetical protein
MAFSVYVQGIPDKEFEGSWRVDNVAWPTSVIERDPRFRPVALNGGYMDYVAVFSIEEAVEMNRQYSSRGLPHWQAKSEELQRVLEERKDATSLILVRMYEWESGLPD